MACRIAVRIVSIKLSLHVPTTWFFHIVFFFSFYCSLKCHGFKLLAKCWTKWNLNSYARKVARSHNLMEKYDSDFPKCGWNIVVRVDSEDRIWDHSGGKWKWEKKRNKTVNLFVAFIYSDFSANRAHPRSGKSLKSISFMHIPLFPQYESC